MALSHNTMCGLLAMLMSELSEEHMYTGWLSGLECILWSALFTKPIDTHWRDIRLDKLEMLRELSAELGGWIVSAHDEQNQDKDYGNLMHGLRFVTLDEWLPLYEKYERTGRCLT